MSLEPRETPAQKKARLRREAASRSKTRRAKNEEAADPFCQNIKPKKGKGKSQDKHPD